jgi:hypothetical protein
MLAFELAVRLFVGLGLLQRHHLRLGQHQALLGAFRLQRLEPLLHGFQVVAQPHAAHAGQQNRAIQLAHLVGNADLAGGALLQR